MKFIDMILNDKVLLFSLIAIIVLIILCVVIIICGKKRNRKEIMEVEQLLNEPQEELLEEKTPEIESIENVIKELDQNQPRQFTTTFEQEQEEKAIISYQELLNTVKQNDESFELEDSIDEINQPIENMEQIENNQALENNEILIDDKPIQEKKFKNSEFISPVFGKQSNKNDDFLKALKDFRNNL